jgi:hypothetical protein
MIITVNKVFAGTLDLSALERVEDLGVDKLPFHLIVRPGQVIEVDDRWYNLVNIQSSLKAGYITITNYNPGGGGGTWGSITGVISSQTDLFANLNEKANISGQIFTGNVSSNNLSGLNTGDETQITILEKLGNTGVVSGTYTNANLEVDSYGRLINASNGSAGVMDHASLSNLDYTSSNHTGFQPYTANVSSFANDIGYLTAETDPIFVASNAYSITLHNIQTLANTSGINTGNQDLTPYLTVSNASSEYLTISNAASYALMGSNVSSFANDVGYIIDAPIDSITYGRKNGNWAEVTTTETDPLSLHLNGDNWIVNSPLSYSNVSNSVSIDLSPYALIGSNVSSFVNDSNYIDLTNISATSPINYSNSTGAISFINPGYITKTDLSDGTGISYNNVSGVITNSSPDQIVSISNSTHVSITGTYPNFSLIDTAQVAGNYLTSVTAHSLLSVTHDDTLADTVASGDIMVGNATPKWSRLAKGVDGKYLKLVSGLPSWEDGGSPDLSPYAKLDGTNQPFTKGIQVTGSTDMVQLKILGNSTQTSNLMDVFASDGTTANFHILGDGKVGIGTTAPVLPLQILGVRNLPASSGTTQTGTLGLRSLGTGVMNLGTMTGGGGWIQVSESSNLATNYNLLLSPNGGNVGIGTTAPTQKLNISGSDESTSFLVENISSVSGQYPGFEVANYQGSTTGHPVWYLSTAGGTKGSPTTLPASRTAGLLTFRGYAGGAFRQMVRIAGVSTSNFSDTDWESALTFTVADGTSEYAEKMRILGSGNVGIGTSAPSAKLQVTGDADSIQLKVVGNATQTTNPFQITTSAAANILSVSNAGVINVISGTSIRPSADGTAAINFATNGGTSIFNVDTTNSRIGIGLVAPLAKLHSQTTTEQLRLGYDVNNYIKNEVSSSGSLTQTATGTTTSFNFVPSSNTQSTIARGLAVNTGLVAGATGSFVAKGSVDQTLLITDTTNDRVGVGVASPTVKLDVGGSMKCGAASTDTITMTGRFIPRSVASDPTANATAGTVGEIVYYSNKWYGKTTGSGTDTNWSALN